MASDTLNSRTHGHFPNVKGTQVHGFCVLGLPGPLRPTGDPNSLHRKPTLFQPESYQPGWAQGMPATACRDYIGGIVGNTGICSLGDYAFSSRRLALLGCFACRPGSYEVVV